MHLFTTAGAGRRLRRALLAVTVTAGALATGAIAQLGAAPTASTASVATTWSASGPQPSVAWNAGVVPRRLLVEPMNPTAAGNTRASPRAKTRDSRTTPAPDSA